MRYVVFILLAVLSSACMRADTATLEGRPGGPYRLTLTLDPVTPAPGEPAQLTFAVTYSTSGKPVTDLQITHERLLHTFIVNRDFSSFAHIHHEDFAPLSPADQRAARVSFPYRFPSAGHYRIVSEFAHRDRSWTKHFDIAVGTTSAPAAFPGLAMEATTGAYTGRLASAPERPRAGQEIDLSLSLTKDGEPVTDLQLHLGTEMHGAVWREDGAYFGHLHSYTPKVAAIMALAHDRDVPPAARGARIATMMVQLMCLDAELVFAGPRVPMRYVFPAGGRYHVFLQVAPHGVPHVFQFALDVDEAGA